jgi:hypothetical protein
VRDSSVGPVRSQFKINNLTVPPGTLDGGPSVRRVAHHLDVLVHRQQTAQGLTHSGIVIGQDDSHGGLAWKGSSTLGVANAGVDRAIAEIALPNCRGVPGGGVSQL